MPPQQQVAHQATRIPSWLLAVGLVGFAGGTYAYVIRQLGGNLEEQLAAEAARQDSLERRPQQQQQQK